MRVPRAVVAAAIAAALCLPAPPAPAAPPAGEVEIREYRGERLDPFARGYDNSIRGPQEVAEAGYRLGIGGLVEEPQALTYAEVLSLPAVERVVTLHCVEGWDERLLFGGVRLVDLLALARPRPGATTVIFHAADGYSSALPLALVRERDLLLAARVNGLRLDAARGFPFQVVAESRYGYKWVRWLTRIELAAGDYEGYWESRGYPNDAAVPAERERTRAPAPP